MTLTEFLLARIAEDEEYAHEMSDSSHLWINPARVLAECEAKRQIVERHANSGATGCYICVEAARDFVVCVEQRILAAVYADHPDYRDEWRP